MNTNQIIQGDSRNVLADMDSDSVHAVVTDPPYGLAFMGRDWDDFEPREYQDWCEQWARQALDVLKPGGHLLAFSGNRTHHRAFAGVEDAGFEIRDTLTWHYGSGFPKASDIGKTIDKRADAEREVVDTRRQRANSDESDVAMNNSSGDVEEITAPATDAAKKWDGWKTGLKPATEYIVMARKPFGGATVDCVQAHGTGALNIEACRVASSDDGGFWPGQDHEVPDDKLYGDGRTGGDERHDEGRYPSNVVFHEGEAERLDAEVGDLGESKGGSDASPFNNGGMMSNGHDRDYDATVGKGDSGGPSRYFYTSKASKSERTHDGQIDNAHPTVKPVDLMEWLVRLVTRQDQIVLDPFAGSGTTCLAAKNEHRQFIGIEKQAQWADVARARCGLAPKDPSHLRSDEDAQTGLEAYGDD